MTQVDTQETSKTRQSKNPQKPASPLPYSGFFSLLFRRNGERWEQTGCLPTDTLGNVLMELIQQLLSLIEQLLLAVKMWLESFIEFSLKDLRKIFQQPLVAVDLGLDCLQLIERG